ncbi:MAG: hypothetical protein IB618_02355 [Candidatus Pacearchaeota archaeon]|nr:MAG: hypothetical protein IB618_02355 [Candidatus Pacearchaeota archaeon]
MEAKKALIFDSGAIITLALNDLLYILEPLKRVFRGEFYIPEPVKKEVIDRSLQSKKFMLEALMIKSLINKGILKVIPSSKILKRETKKILDIANHTFKTEGEWIRLIHEGETSCLALFNLIDAKDKAIVIDERTTRMLCEAPKNLHRLLETKLQKKIKAIEENYSFFKNFKIIRSSELGFIAYKKRIIQLPAKSKDALRAILYATKYKGCAISNYEIEIAKKL